MRVKLVFAWLVLVAMSLAAQSELATLSGVVTDRSGAVLVGARVKAIHTATNTSTETVTNETGRYFFPSLRPGVYSVTVSQTGFKTSINDTVTLQVND